MRMREKVGPALEVHASPTRVNRLLTILRALVPERFRYRDFRFRGFRTE
jgi:hypothetical protein